MMKLSLTNRNIEYLTEFDESGFSEWLIQKKIVKNEQQSLYVLFVIIRISILITILLTGGGYENINSDNFVPAEYE